MNRQTFEEIWWSYIAASFPEENQEIFYPPQTHESFELIEELWNNHPEQMPANFTWPALHRSVREKEPDKKEFLSILQSHCSDGKIFTVSHGSTRLNLNTIQYVRSRGFVVEIAPEWDYYQQNIINVHYVIRC